MKVLIVEDEKKLSDTLRDFLLQEKYIIECVYDYNSALDKIYAYDYDCIVLDLMLPGGDGLSLLKEIKQLHKPVGVLIISAKGSVDDKVSGLDLGADDYLSKPFHLAEFNARIKSIIRRNQSAGEVLIELQNLSLDPDKRIAIVNNEPLLLNRKEFDLLYYFITNPERLIYKTALAEAVWGDNIDQADSMDFIYSQVKNLRKKLKDANADVTIKAVYGFGYKLTNE